MSARVIIADAAAADARRMKGRLASARVEAILVETVEDVLRITREWQPDVVLLGVSTRASDSLEICAQLKGDPVTAATMVVLTAAHGESAHELHGLEAGADDFLNEPDELGSLVQRVRGLVRLKRTKDEWLASVETAKEFLVTLEREPAPVVHGARAIIFDDRESEGKSLSEWLVRDGVLATMAPDARDQGSSATVPDLIVLSLALGRHDLSGASSIFGPERTYPHVPLLLLSDRRREAGPGSLGAGAADWVVRPLTEGKFRARARNRILYQRYRGRLQADRERVRSGRDASAPGGVFGELYARRHLSRLLGSGGRQELAVLVIKIDRTGRPDEEEARPAEEESLRVVATTLRTNLRIFDTLARYGEDGFIVLMPGTASAEATSAGERLRDAVASLALAPGGAGTGPHVTVSMGIAADPGTAGAETLLARAQEALRRAQRAGANRVEVAKPP